MLVREQRANWWLPQVYHKHAPTRGFISQPSTQPAVWLKWTEAHKRCSLLGSPEMWNTCSEIRIVMSSIRPQQLKAFYVRSALYSMDGPTSCRAAFLRKNMKIRSNIEFSHFGKRFNFLTLLAPSTRSSNKENYFCLPWQQFLKEIGIFRITNLLSASPLSNQDGTCLLYVTFIKFKGDSGIKLEENF